MLSDRDIEIAKRDYINSQFSIRIYKAKGKENTIQIYNGNKQELATCIASMVEQLIRNEVFSPNEMLTIINMAVENLKRK